MQFVIVAHDGTDQDAPARRAAIRSAHTAKGNQLLETGNLLYRAPLTDEQGNMNGSLYVVDFPTRTDLQNWLDTEPSVTGNVWHEIDIHHANIPRP